MSAEQASPLKNSPKVRAVGSPTSRSTSSSKMAADLPPNSRLTRRRSRPQSAAISAPAAVLPVNDTRSTPRCWVSATPVWRSPGRMLTTPGGMPAASTASAIRYEDSGVSGAVFTTMEQPASMAGTAFIRICMTGPFQGTTPATTPSGL